MFSIILEIISTFTSSREIYKGFPKVRVSLVCCRLLSIEQLPCLGPFSRSVIPLRTSEFIVVLMRDFQWRNNSTFYINPAEAFVLSERKWRSDRRGRFFTGNEWTDALRCLEQSGVSQKSINPHRVPKSAPFPLERI